MHLPTPCATLRSLRALALALGFVCLIDSCKLLLRILVRHATGKVMAAADLDALLESVPKAFGQRPSVVEGGARKMFGGRKVGLLFATAMFSNYRLKIKTIHNGFGLHIL